MKIIDTHKFLAHNPTKIGTVFNQVGQHVVFYEHPTMGSDAPVYGKIGSVCFKTDFYDLDDMRPDSDYLPILIDGGVVCAFEAGY